jgi:hypothetical protein
MNRGQLGKITNSRARLDVPDRRERCRLCARPYEPGVDLVCVESVTDPLWGSVHVACAARVWARRRAAA